MNRHRDNHIYDDKSGGEMLSEIMRLLLKLILKSAINLLRLIVKGILFLQAIINRGIKACIDFWHSNSTQEKIRMATRWCQQFIKDVLIYTVIAIKWICYGTIWLITVMVKGCIHLKPTIIYIGHLFRKVLQGIGKGLQFMCQSIATFYKNRKVAYQNFRQTKGFKGLLIDTKNYLQKSLDDYMNEGQEDKESTAMGYGEYITEEIGNDGRTTSFIHKIYNGLTKFLDND